MVEQEQPLLTIRLFGGFLALREDTLVRSLATRDGDRLLALLILQQPREVSSADVAQTLWPATGSLDSLRQSVIQVRHVLGEQSYRLQTMRGGMILDLEGVEVDVLAFDMAIAQGDPDSLKRAAGLYRGPLLQGWDERWVQKERERRKESYLEALQVLAEVSLTRQEYREVMRWLRRYVTTNPAAEWAWRDLIQTAIVCGERVEALNLYEKYEEYLRRHKLFPPEEMKRLYGEIRAITPRTLPDPSDLSLLDPAGGALPLDSPFYISRSADAIFQAAVAKRHSVVLVKGPRQTGKTSLLARGLQQAREQRMRPVLTDLQKLSAMHWASADTLYRALAQDLADQLDLETTPAETWNAARGANENFEHYLRRHVLGKITLPLVWGLDEVDRIFDRDYRSDVFGLFRSWHNVRAMEPGGPFDRLTLVIAYATEAHLFIQDLNQSPFNVGTRVALQDFSLPEVEELNRRYGAPLDAEAELARFYRWIGGHPYLAQRGLQELVAYPQSMEDFEAASEQDTGCFGDHLKRMLLALSQDKGLRDAVCALLQGHPCTGPESFYRLRSAGILVGEELQRAQLRSEVYRSYLKGRLL